MTAGPISPLLPDVSLLEPGARLHPVPAPAPSRELVALRESWMSRITLRGALVEQGWTDRALANQLKDRVLVRPRRGAYAAYDDFVALDDRGRHAMVSRAVLLQASAPTSLSHGSSLVWTGAPSWGLDLDHVHCTRHDERAGRREAGIVQHRGQLLHGDLVEIHGVSMTHPCRAVLELTTLPGITVEIALAHANYLLNTAQVTLDQLNDRFALMRDWPDSAPTEIVLRLANPKIQSILESRFDALCYRNSLPRPVPQYEVRSGLGDLVAQLDFAWPTRGKYVEMDGGIKYGELLKQDETARDVVLREKERDKLVKRLTGMDGERFVWLDLEPENEPRTVARVRALLDG